MAHLPPDTLADNDREALEPLVRTAPVPRAVDPETARYLLLNAVVQALSVVGQAAPVVLVLDDLQWADVPSLQLLRFVVSAPDVLRLLVLGTFRESELDAAHPLTDLLAALHRQEGAARLSLRGLGDLELLERRESRSGQHSSANERVSQNTIGMVGQRTWYSANVSAMAAGRAWRCLNSDE